MRSAPTRIAMSTARPAGRRVSTRHPRGLADTNIAIHLERLQAEQLAAELLTAAVTLAELPAGVHRCDDVAERGRRLTQADVLLRHAP
jgi:predicted nucleic acid-binding protein